MPNSRRPVRTQSSWLATSMQSMAGAWGHSPSLGDPTGAQSSQSSTIPATLCKAMYLSAVMKVPFSRGSCTSRSHPHFWHASGIHWRGSELVVMPVSSQPAAAYPFGRADRIIWSRGHASHRKDQGTAAGHPYPAGRRLLAPMDDRYCPSPRQLIHGRRVAAERNVVPTALTPLGW